MTTNTHYHQVLKLVDSRGLIRSRDLDAISVPRVVLTRMVQRGLLIRVGRGLYSAPNRPVSEHTSLVEVSRKYPQALVCLLSALQFHSLTTQAPFEVWLAIPNKAYAPTMEYPPLRIVRFSTKSIAEGVEDHLVEGVTVHVTCIAKTVADCFKFRNKIGLDVALEALNESWRSKRVKMDELWHYASICRVTNVIRPYLESLAS
ncbi:type IV toxin-antitoxin system AbiEi family antitoxin domain-containing protein [Zooshikella harenae]|uniref:Type IV toxin-antitoxin system AbiEi family antitoxin domain-containing protein n=1 Tax=Zooshikella harenae TaxID=2827238 RepID=A0ABS5ZIU9_9GAMM|nr:type IV toxin-antitoxin system AbiEi family antitoxin domain-containing protein [Zooshikella harenae]MBU2714006.1 type IV toxin-antitoxin system AbiEi family antitoxin domain-containing protein [Zooshikella harenae]